MDPASALARLAAHVAKPSKFARAASLAATLMRSGALERRHGKALHALLAAAMHPSPRRACDDPGTRLEYRRLFDAAEACARDGVLNAKHAARLDVWLIHARLVNDVHVDDSFAFAAALKAGAKRVDALPEYEEPPAGPGPGDAADEIEIETETEIDDDPSRRPPGGPRRSSAPSAAPRATPSTARTSSGGIFWTTRARRFWTASTPPSRSTASRGRKPPWRCSPTPSTSDRDDSPPSSASAFARRGTTCARGGRRGRVGSAGGG